MKPPFARVWLPYFRYCPVVTYYISVLRKKNQSVFNDLNVEGFRNANRKKKFKKRWQLAFSLFLAMCVVFFFFFLSYRDLKL